jgi:hypothetical protein
MPSYPIAPKPAALAALLILALAPVARAQAQDRPPLLPTRDVEVDYTTTANGHDNRLHMLFSAKGQHLRVEAAGQSSYVLIDGHAKRMNIVMDRQRSVMAMPFDPDHLTGFLLSESAHYTRGATATVAGLTCTTWTVDTQQGKGTACVTDDGVILRARAAGQSPTGESGTGVMEATAVHYGPQPESVFAVPAGYKVMGLTDLPHRAP